ncbi:MAG: hypothetical protein JKY37_25085 [Nannocystaceae bacterium]|nr:hypothetical protein [Nannocystaceae bacterium]
MVNIALEGENALNFTVSMSLDLHRTGDPDGLIEINGNGDWVWGKTADGGIGAVVLVNHDDDDGSDTHDNADGIINADRDKNDLAPLRIKTSQEIPDTWNISLSVDDYTKLRVLRGDGEVLGPDRAAPYQLTVADLVASRGESGLPLFMEAITFASQGFDGLVKLTLTVTPPAILGLQPVEDEATVRVAPWMIPHHGVPATHVYVSKLDSNADFRARLKTEVIKSRHGGFRSVGLVEIDVKDLVEWVDIAGVVDLFAWCAYRGFKTLLEYTGGEADTNAVRLFRDRLIELPSWVAKEAGVTVAEAAGDYGMTEAGFGALEFSGPKNSELADYRDDFDGWIAVGQSVRLEIGDELWIQAFADLAGLNLDDFLDYAGGTADSNRARAYSPGYRPCTIVLPPRARKRTAIDLATFAGYFGLSEAELGELDRWRNDEIVAHYGVDTKVYLAPPATVRIQDHFLAWLEFYAGACDKTLEEFLRFPAPSDARTVAEQMVDLPCRIAVDELDPWAQDCMEIGYTSLPGHNITSVLRASRNRTLHHYPRTLLAAEVGDWQPGDLTHNTTYDSFGNLEVTPPVRGPDGTEYPWGRIYFGNGDVDSQFEPKVRTFLQQQVVQKPFEIHTNWLSVGHVDEFISFVPVSGNPSLSGRNRPEFPYRVLLASPKAAHVALLKALRSLDARRHETGLIFEGRSFDGFNIETDLKEYDDNGLEAVLGYPPATTMTALNLKNWNEEVQGIVDGVRRVLIRELGILDNEIIDVPVLYHRNNVSRKFDALTTAMMNMLVINGHCIYPTPFGPTCKGVDYFKADFEAKLTDLGLVPHAIDDWNEYHLAQGEVHCGTNTLRKPEPAHWWEFIAP